MGWDRLGKSEITLEKSRNMRAIALVMLLVRADGAAGHDLAFFPPGLMPEGESASRAFGPGKGIGGNKGSDFLIELMTDQKASFEDRLDAEDALAKIPPQEVLPKLLPHIAKGMPSGGIWNRRGARELDRTGPVPWQIYYAVHRLWDGHTARLSPKEGGRFLIGLLKKEEEEFGKIAILGALQDRWFPDAEPDVAQVLNDPRQPGEVRLSAALLLILNGKEDYRDVLLKAARAAEAAEKHRWYNLLVDPRHKERKGVDPRVIVLGFELLQAEIARDANFVHGAYFLAVRIGPYVGQEFAPDRNDPRYKAKGGFNKLFFVDTVQNALRWWEDNRARIEKGIAPEKKR